MGALAAACRPGSVRVKLVDLGSCFSVTAMDTLHATIDAQTLPYRAPEVGLTSGPVQFHLFPFGQSLVQNSCTTKHPS